MDKTTFAEIVTSAWYTYEGLTEEELVNNYNYQKENVKTGAKLCRALEKK